MAGSVELQTKPAQSTTFIHPPKRTVNLGRFSCI